MWYQKKIVVIPAIIAGLLVFSGLGDTQQIVTPEQTRQAPVHVVSLEPAKSAVSPTPAPSKVGQPIVQPTTQSGLSNDNYYENVDGNQVHSPAYSDDVPIGAAAQCRDGTYSFSQHRSGTCSHHGGVATWL